jgi:hypothetical protein
MPEPRAPIRHDWVAVEHLETALLPKKSSGTPQKDPRRNLGDHNMLGSS